MSQAGSGTGGGSESSREALARALRARVGDRVVLALGGGAARGFAHIGVLRVLHEAGVQVAGVVGTSIGSVVGGAFAAGHLDGYEAMVRGMQGQNLLRHLDPRLGGGGVFAGLRLVRRVGAIVGDPRIEELPMPYRAVTVALDNGEEVVLERGSLLTAMRASSAIPGMFQPVQVGGRWLVDGGLASPVPLRAAKALAAGLPVIAVDLNDPSEDLAPVPARPTLRGVLGEGIAIVCHHLTQLQLAADPPALLVAPRLADRGLFDLDAVEEVIQRGRDAVSESLGLP